jgi:hypothetical protein
MDTAERARALALALRGFTGWAPVTAEGLVDLVRTDLGHPGVLDGFQVVGGIRSMARPVGPLLHVISGNTPAAGVQSLARGLLLGAENFAKLPQDAPGCQGAVESFLSLLPTALRSRVEVRKDLPHEWLDRAAAVIVFGSDDTVSAVRARTRPDQILRAHGHAVSLGVVWSDPSQASVPAAAEDVAAYDQHGCLSLQAIYVGGPEGAARQYAQCLATALAASSSSPHAPAPPGAATVIANLRSAYRFRSAQDPGVALWHGDDPASYTVVLEPDPAFAPSPGFRTVFVMPLPDDPTSAVDQVRRHLSTVAVYPFDGPAIDCALAFGARRVCPLGQAQRPSVFWHQDGLPALSPFVRWTDLG